jgi:hypothetical protein
MNANDKRIIDNIRGFIKVNYKEHDDKFEKDNFLSEKLFGIPKQTFSDNKKKFEDDTPCQKGLIGKNNMKHFRAKVKKLEQKFKTPLLSGFAAAILSEFYDECYKEFIEDYQATKNEGKDDAKVFFKTFPNTNFVKSMLTSEKPLFICSYSESALHDMLSMFYNKNIEFKDKRLDLLLNDSFYANNFEILRRVISNIISMQQDNGGYNDSLILDFYKIPASSDEEVFFNMIGLGTHSEQESCGLVYDESNYHQLSKWGQDYIYQEYKQHMQWFNNSSLLEMVNILPGRNNF